MFRWVSIIGSSITIALFVLFGFATVAEERCPIAMMAIVRVDTSLLDLQSSCAVFYTTFTYGTFFCGIVLTVLLLVAHLIEAARKRAWELFLTLLMGPLFCIFGSEVYIVSSPGASFTLIGLTISGCGALIGLLNLSFGIFGLKPKRGSGSPALPGAETAPTPRLSETPEQQQG